MNNPESKIVIEKSFICPIATGADPWEFECQYVNSFYCRHSSVAHLELAIKKDLMNCPYDFDPEGDS